MRLGVFVVLALAGCGRGRPPSAESLYRQAREFLRSEHYQEAAAQADQGLGAVQPGSSWQWKLLLLRAEILIARREPAQARAALAQVHLPSGPPWDEDWARYRLCQANIAYRQNDPSVLPRLDEAQAFAAAARAAGLLQEIELRRASLEMRRGQFDAAEVRIRHVREAAGPDDLYLQMSAAGNMGYLFLQSFRYEEAIPWCQRALDFSKRLRAADSQARALGNLGTCYEGLGDLDRAQHYYEESIALTGNRAEQQLRIGQIGNLYFYRREYPRASQNYQRALAAARDLGARDSMATWLHNLALISIETADWPAAEKYNTEAAALWRDLHDRSSEMYSMANAGRIATGKSDFAQAQKLFHEVLRAPLENPELLVYTHSGLAHAYVAAGRDREAEAEFRATDALIEHQRSELTRDESKLSYFSARINFYQDYVDFLMARGKVSTALEVAESSRARNLADKLRLAHSGLGRRTAAGFQAIAAAYDSTLLSYWLAPQKSYLWVVTPSRIAWFPLPPASQIRDWVERYDAFLQRRRDPLEMQPEPARQLYDALVKPALPLLPKSGQVIVVPDGPLYSLNFETLPDLGSKPHYWIDDATVSVAPSLGLLSPPRAPTGSSSHALLLIGNPVSPSEDYPTLQFSGREMTNIENSLPAFQKVVYSGPQAQPEAYSRSDPGRFALIHFVAHASANREEPLESAVILSRSGTNYRLLARDVIHTPLRAELVTISACRSAGARTYAGEGLVGFSWAFLEAGASNVIAGLWEVDDQATADLMSHLYAGLARDRNPSEALRAAKQQMLHSSGAYRKPYYWGPFQVFTRRPGGTVR